MQTYLRILKFAHPYRLFVPQYAVLITLSIIFGLVNFALFIPLLDTLFNSVEKVAMPENPTFSFGLDYFKAKFNYVFQSIIQESGQIAALRFVCIAAVISVVLKNIFRYLAMMILAIVRTGVIKNLRDTLYQKLIQMHTGYFKNNKKGDLMSRVMSDVQEIENSVVNTFTVIFREPFTIIFSFVLLFLMSWQLTAFTLIILPISALIISTIVIKEAR
jgi:subfamily B ATP-binding cassette protein MsbA